METGVGSGHWWKWEKLTTYKYLHIVRLHYCVNSFSRVSCVLVPRYQRIHVKIWIQIQYCPSIRPIPSPVHRPLVPYYLFAVNVIDGCSHTCTTQSILRCMLVQSSALRPHLLSHKWRPFRDNLQKRESKHEYMAPWRNALRPNAHLIRQVRIVWTKSN